MVMIISFTPSFLTNEVTNFQQQSIQPLHVGEYHRSTTLLNFTKPTAVSNLPNNYVSIAVEQSLIENCRSQEGKQGWQSAFLTTMGPIVQQNTICSCEVVWSSSMESNGISIGLAELSSQIYNQLKSAVCCRHHSVSRPLSLFIPFALLTAHSFFSPY